MLTDQELCAKAAVVLEERGHVKGILEHKDGRVCAIGALMVAADISPYLYSDREYVRIEGAVALVRQYLLPECQAYVLGGTAYTLAAWNNKPERTAQEVIDLFRTAGGVDTEDQIEAEDLEAVLV